MSEPCPTLFGEILGLSTGIHAQAVAPVSKEDFVRAKTMTDHVFAQGPFATQAFLSEFQALYLPAFLKTFYFNTIGDFNAVDPDLFVYYLEIGYKIAASPYCDLFIRQHLKEASECQVSAEDMQEQLLIVRYEIARHSFRKLSDIIKIGLLFGIKRNVRWALHLASLPPSELSPTDLTDEEFLPRVPVYQQQKKEIFEMERRDREEYKKETGRDKLLEMGGRDVDFEECAANEGGVRVQCEENELQEPLTCPRCHAVEYCSEAHRELHWIDHKPFCFPPTWWEDRDALKDLWNSFVAPRF